jgi:hypothetical protein
MKPTIKATAITLTLLAQLGAGVPGRAQDFAITSFTSNGQLTWTNAALNARCRIDWAPHAEGPWHSNWASLESIVTTNGGGVAEVPMFYRVAAVTNQTQLGGTNLVDWAVALGDSTYSAPEEPAVTAADIDTVHTNDYSELRADMSRRRIMAHNNVIHSAERFS